MKNRNNGIDLLRIVLMVMIVLGHLFTHTGLRVDLDFLSNKWIITWWIQAFTICAVDCFVLISGYFGYESNGKLISTVKLWGKVVFYSVIITISLFFLGYGDYSWRHILSTLCPVLCNKYWFFTYYLVLSLFRPFLNRLINTLSVKQVKRLMVLIIVLFFIEPILSFLFVPFDPNEGFSILSFISLYIIGASLNKMKFSINSTKSLVVLVLSSSIMLLSKITLTIIVEAFSLNAGTALLYHYNTLFVLVNSMCLFFLFYNIKIPKRIGKKVFLMSQSVFAVYLIHEEPTIRELLWNNRMEQLMLDSSLLQYILIMICLSVGITISGCIIDQIFSKLSKPLLLKSRVVKKIDTICMKYDAIWSN